MYIERNAPPTGFWGNARDYMVSLLKAYWGDAATKDNNYGYDYLPHLDGDHSHMTTVAAMADGGVKGYFLMGENPTVGSMHGALHRKGLRRLDWLVERAWQLVVERGQQAVGQLSALERNATALSAATLLRGPGAATIGAVSDCTLRALAPPWNGPLSLLK